MEGLICKTTATGPASLKIKGGGDLNVGKKLTTDSISNASGQTVTADDLTYDRYNKGVRPDSDTWTMGAYQGEKNVLVETIYWVGVSEKWDDRNNWGFYPTEGASLSNTGGAITRSVDLQRLSCVNNLSDKLKVIIPERPLVQVQDGRKWPQLPGEFTPSKRAEGEEGIPVEEHVSAGIGVIDADDLTMFADTIELEYGAAIKGIENLTNGNVHYGSATMNFTAPRNKWTLVGTVVMPYDENGNPRNVKSGDYFITGQTPHVYMHNVELSEDGNSYSWTNPFSSLEMEVSPNTAFAIQIPDQYGPYKLPASYYHKFGGEKFDPNQEIEYGVYPGSKGPFTGKFVNDHGDNPIVYNLNKGKWNLLNNSYPCNINARAVTEGSIKIFDTKGGSFIDLASVPSTETVLLKPQHGFFFKASDVNSDKLTITSGKLADGNTRSRAAEVEMPTISINLYNANTDVQFSNIVVKLDEMLGENETSSADVEKLFAPINETPELYVVNNDGKYSVVNVSSTEKSIPLGIKIRKSMNVRFERVWYTGFSKVILWDKETNMEYDLLEKSYTTTTLEAGDVEGRFFLFLEESNIEEELPDDDDITTNVEDNSAASKAINIFVEEADNTIKVITDGVELETIYVSDMAGRTMRYNVSGYAVNLKLPVANGVYTINVIGDTASRTGKVILK
jgi:hypothetical protein